MAFYLGPFSGHDFGQARVRPNCRASPLFAKNCGQKVVSVLGTAGGRLHFESRIRARQVLTDPGLTFGFGLGFRFMASGLLPEVWSPSGVALLLSLRPLLGYESSSFVAAQAALLFLAFLIRSRPVYGSWLVERNLELFV